MKNTHFTPLQSCLISLNNIANRLWWTNHFLDEYVKKYSDEIKNIESKISDGKQLKQIQHIILIFFDHITLNLYSLLETHPIVLKHLEELNLLKLEESLVECWAPIEKKRKKIERWRNCYTAHAKFGAINFQTINMFDKDYVNTEREMFFLSKCALMYIGAIFCNIEKEYHISMKLIKQKAKSEDPILIFDVWDKVEQLKTDVENELRQNNFKTNFDISYN